MTHRTFRMAAAISAGAGLIALAAPAKADDYTDLLDVLKARGSLSQSEYDTLASRHNKRAPLVRAGRGGRNAGDSSPATFGQQAAQQAPDSVSAAGSPGTSAAIQAAVDSAMTKAMASPEIVHAMPYTPGKGAEMRVGSVDLNFSGFVNGFYTYSSADRGGPGHTVAGGLADASGFDSSAVRGGLLPGALIFKASTVQDGIDLAVVFGVYPGINSAASSPLGANSGGNPVGLATAGIDFRQSYFTAGTKEFGTVKVGRDIGIFGSDAILSDQTLIGVGATGGNANPANTALGRIGIGYIYADFLPQITYTSPVFAGIQGTLGIVQPLDEFNFSGLSASSAAHDSPMVQGKLTYDIKTPSVTSRLWAGFLIQNQQNIAASESSGNRSQFTDAFDVGAKADVGVFGLTGYYYHGSGVGTTGLFFDGLSAAGDKRDSEGFYVQGSVKPVPKLKLVASYGESSLYQAPGEYNPSLVRRNEAEIAGAYYSLTDWLTLVGEYAHVHASSHGDNKTNQDSVTLGGIVFF